jgi:hypothetical protein
VAISPGRTWLTKFKPRKQRLPFTQGPPTNPIDDDGPILVASSWRLVQRFYVRLPVAFENRLAISVQKSSHFRVLDHVTTSAAVSWNLEQRFFKQERIRYADLYRVRVFTIGGIRFNDLSRVVIRNWSVQGFSPGNISTGLVHPVDFSTPNLQPVSYKGLGTPVVSPIDYDNYPGYGQIVLPGISFRVGIDPSGRVVCQRSVEFNDLNSASGKQRSTWNTIRRYSYPSVSKFNVFVPVKNSTIIEWNIGSWVSSHIRQTSQNRTDFAY